MKPVIDKNKIPTTEDFRPAAIQRALLNHSLNHWSFRYAIPAVLGTVVVGLFFGFSYGLFLTLLGISACASVFFVFNQVINSESFKRKYMNKLLELQEKRTLEKLRNLGEDLRKNNLEDAAKQLNQFKQKFDNLLDILKSKFDESQLTFSRYYGIAREVYLSGIDNLNDILIAKKTMNSIDLGYVSERLGKLESRDQESMVVKKEVDALIRSQYSYKHQEEKIHKLVAENEAALTQIDEATIAISEISKSKNKEAQIDMENSMRGLAEMANRTKLYSR